MSLKITAGKDNVPMPPITLPPLNGSETLEELEAVIHPQVHEWIVKAYPEHKVLETIVRLQYSGDKLWLDFSMQIDPTIGPNIIQGIGYHGDSYRQEGPLHVYPREEPTLE